ncbi:hypothetical protein [Lactobacillus sp. ESL0681]|uniref:hypothetical protein n=1 Tax=Lactobacillus sp. ESL0681 TaxID=2983211 RepID=UPI0023FA4932|nr:hypothetical protein [Lactobacillus sp. ESL0681]WEV39852.1 hypothetical protein OZX59_06480 [Lactobacillus sp. ESL0681]
MKVFKILSAVIETVGFVHGLLLFFSEIGGVSNPNFELRAFSTIYAISGVLMVVGCVLQALDIFSKFGLKYLVISELSCSVLSFVYIIILYNNMPAEIYRALFSILIIVILIVLDFLKNVMLGKF